MEKFQSWNFKKLNSIKLLKTHKKIQEQITETKTQLEKKFKEVLNNNEDVSIIQTKWKEVLSKNTKNIEILQKDLQTIEEVIQSRKREILNNLDISHLSLEYIMELVKHVTEEKNNTNQTKQAWEFIITWYKVGYSADDELNSYLTNWPYNALQSKNIKTIWQLVDFYNNEGDEGLLKIRRFWEKKLKEIKLALKNMCIITPRQI